MMGSRDKEPSCINCGGAGHWAIACPEPTRQIPAGVQTKRPAEEKHRSGGKHGAKRHKGPIVNKYAPPTPAAVHGSHPPPSVSPYGGYGHPDQSYPPPLPPYATPGHFSAPAPPPGPPPYSAPPHLASAPPHPYGPPGGYAARPPSLPPTPGPYGQPAGYPGGPSGPPPTPQLQPFGTQHHHPQYHQPYPQGHGPSPPPNHYDYLPPQTHPYPQHPYAPPPPPPSRSPGRGHSFPGGPPHTHPPPGGPPYASRSAPEFPPHHSPTPPGSVPHGYPPSLPLPPNIGGPGSLIRVLPPKPTVQVPPHDRGHGRRKDRNRSGRNKRNKDKHAASTKGKGEQARKNEPKPPAEEKKAAGTERPEDGTIPSHDGPAETPGVEQANLDADGTDSPSKTSERPEEGEVMDEDPDWAWDEKTIFQEPEKVHFADAVAGPLPAEYTDKVLLPPAWNAKCIVSTFVNADNKTDFCRPVWETPLWKRYKNTPPFGSPREPRALLTYAELRELLEMRRSSLNPGPRREPKPGSRKLSSFLDRGRTGEDRGRTMPFETSASPERTPQQRDRRPVIDSYRPTYERGRRSRSPSRDRRRRREDFSPRGRDSPNGMTTHFSLPLEERSRDSSVESDLNSLENELLGLSPKSPSDDGKETEANKVEVKKKVSDDAIPKSRRRRRVQVDSAFGRRW